MKPWVLALAAALVVALSGWAQAAPALDPGFGSGGITTVGPGLGGGFGMSISVQPGTGRVIEMGVADTPIVPGGKAFQAAAFTSSGSLDQTFGSGGVAQLAVEGYGKMFPSGGAVLANGKVSLAGFGRGAPDRSNADDGLILRLTAAGALDPSFGGDGIVMLRSSRWTRTHLRAVVQQQDGKLVLAGDVAPAFTTDHSALAVWRLLPNGDRDLAFGRNGVRLLDLSTTEDILYNVAIGSRGRIVASGVTKNNVSFRQNGVIVALTPDGDLDPTFNQRGYLRVDLRGYPSTYSNFSQGLAVGPKGAIFDLESVGEGLTITKYTPRGMVSSFNDGQRVYYNVGTNAYGLTLDREGRILALVHEGGWSLVRWRKDGTGPTHAVGMFAVLPDHTTVSMAWAQDVGIAPDGSYYVAGTTHGLMSAAHVFG